MRVALGSDEDTALATALRNELRALGHDVVEPVAVGDPWPDVGRSVGDAVAAGDADLGVVCCWTGTGVSLAASKVRGVRAALCVDAETARGARRWNDANVLALSNRLTTPAAGTEILRTFLATIDVDPDERPNIDRIE